MKCCQVQVYLAGRLKNGQYQVKAAMSYNLTWEIEELASMGYEWLWVLTEEMGLHLAYLLIQRLHALPWARWSPNWQTDPRIKKITSWLHKERLLKENKIQILPQKRPIAIFPEGLKLIDESFQIISAMLRGRNLFFSEIVNGLQEMGLSHYSPQVVQKNLLQAIVHNKVELIPAVSPEQGECFRCGHVGLQLSQCGICGERIWFCPECSNMGESLSCRPLFRRADKGVIAELAQGVCINANLSDTSPQQTNKGLNGVGSLDYRSHLADKFKPRYNFSLSPYQKEISERLAEMLDTDRVRRWLLWAVCGAGKTETTFELISRVLQRAGRVLFTSPRREVIRQMVERLQEAFSDVKIVGLYGGSKIKFSQAQITVATVHQLVRFYQAFDLVIFDEVDAYPYQGDRRLVNLLQRSLKKDGRMVLLSATPSDELLKEAKDGELRVLTLPARFHRKGVPIPELYSLRLPILPEYTLMPQKVKKWIIQSLEKDLAQLYIFLPSRKMVEIFGESLQKYYQKKGLADWVQYTHSQDKKRSQKVQEFLRGTYPILVTTTILERGVTVPKSNVLVLYADHVDIFNHQSLIQMAGRGGRSLYAPFAHVWFAGNRISKEMKIAVNWIAVMNRLAHERGLLDAKSDKFN